MTQTITTHEKLYQQQFNALVRNGASGERQWLHDLRQRAMAAFMELGFPTARRGNEEWKYTDIRPIAQQPFAEPPAAPALPSTEEMDRTTFGESSWHRIAFVDGRFSPELSFLSGLPSGVQVMDLARAVQPQGSLVERNLAQHMAFGDNAFAAMNTAMAQSGAFLHIGDRVALEEPVHIVFIASSAQDVATYPRVLIVAGKDSSAAIVQSYHALDGSRYLSNAVTEVVLGRGASVKHYTVQRHSDQAYHINNTQVVVNGDAHYASVNFDFGGGLVRNNLNVLMNEEGGSCSLNGLYMPTGTQHVDNQVIIDHAKGHTDASEVYKGILNGHSRSVFHGSIIVREGAAKVNASQEDKNLLLSPDAEADTKPAFWIYCDDVKCAHGAACGQIDENALFYLRSRGLSEALAKSLLVSGFVTQIIDSVGLESLRGHVNTLVHTRLGDWLGHEGLL